MKTFIEKRKGNRRNRPTSYMDRRLTITTPTIRQQIWGAIEKELRKKYDVK